MSLFYGYEEEHKEKHKYFITTAYHIPPTNGVVYPWNDPPGVINGDISLKFDYDTNITLKSILTWGFNEPPITSTLTFTMSTIDINNNLNDVKIADIDLTNKPQLKSLYHRNTIINFTFKPSDYLSNYKDVFSSFFIISNTPGTTTLFKYKFQLQYYIH